MNKGINYERTRFSADVLREATQKFHDETNPDSQESRLHLTVEVDGADWTHDSKEEFFADYRRSSGGVVYQEELENSSFRLQIASNTSMVTIKAPERKQIEAVFEVFEKHLTSSRLPSPPTCSTKT